MSTVELDSYYFNDNLSVHLFETSDIYFIETRIFNVVKVSSYDKLIKTNQGLKTAKYKLRSYIFKYKEILSTKNN